MVRLMTVAFATSSIHLKPLNIVRRTARPVEAVSNPAPDDAPEKVKINYRLYATRRMLQLKNMYSPKTFPPCDYCDGSGFVDCPKCNQGCWKCRHTTLIKCHYCEEQARAHRVYILCQSIMKRMGKEKRTDTLTMMGKEKRTDTLTMMGKENTMVTINTLKNILKFGSHSMTKKLHYIRLKI